MRQAFGVDELGVSYTRAVTLSLYVDQRGWLRRLANVARFVHLSLFHQCSPLASARTAAAELVRASAAFVDQR